MADKLKLPVGIEDFREIRRKDFYYIDKTRLIEQLLDSWGKVNLFTRPRRFGKTLNMSMLRYFLKLERIRLYLRDFTSRKEVIFVRNIWESSQLCLLPLKVWMD